ncbi:MAG: pseudouridine synthase [Leptospira sp.]|nr:pseudouridine synthase [Leptospira sp.]
MRINQFLARAGAGSRRKVEEIILAGRVKVNGSTLTDLSYRVAEKDEVRLDGKRIDIKIDPDLFRIIAFNKPAGYLASHEDEHNDHMIFELLPKEYQKYNYAGRLDLDSRGLMFLSNDGDFIQRITHPSQKIEKEYIVTLNKDIEWKPIAEEFMLGVREGGETLRAKFVSPAFPRSLKEDQPTNHLRVVLGEGKKRQIRRMFHSKNLSVIDLFRVRIGNFSLEKKSIDEGKFIGVREEQIIQK